MALVEFAKSELARIDADGADGMQNLMNEHILKMVQVFADEGHSGFSASYAVAVLEKLLRFEPLSPLTGSDDEWNEVGEGVLQNRRCSHVFFEDGQAYDIEGKVFREPSGVCFTSRDSRVPVTFPYTPSREYIDVPASDSDGSPKGEDA